MHPRPAPVLLAALLVGQGVSAPATEEAPLPGYSPRASQLERDIERRFRALPDAERARAWHRYFTAEPHVATSPRNNALADYVAEQWRQHGLEDVVIRRYDVLSSNPREVKVEMVAPRAYVPSLREDPVPEDPDTQRDDISGAWLSFSASGDVTAPVVYANSGNPADYDELRRNGIEPRGKIVIVRYSNPYSYRGFKALTAQREGAAAMIVYSDPAEDGSTRGEVFPKGPWGPASHLQRGGIAFDFIVPGDPLTPGWASVPGARRIPIEEAVSVPKLIAVPMSHRDVQPILEALGGPEAPKQWHGALPIAYRLGGEAAKLRIHVDMQTDIQPNLVVEGRIRGGEMPNEWVVLGNHRDAWVFGGVDPSSGTAAMMEMTRALGLLKQEGIRPKRTLVFCSWDGEEVTLTGSTEWGEQFADALQQKAVAYLNVDSAVAGPNFNVSAQASLAPMIVDLTRELPDPSGVSLFEAWTRSKRAEKATAGEPELVKTRIGSGSDHTVFLNFLGLPVVEMGFDGPYGVYHSAYDDHYWVSKIGDPGFKYHVLMSQLWGSMALRLANADVPPLDAEAYAKALGSFVGAIGEIKGANTELDLAELTARAQALESVGRQLNERVAARLQLGAMSPEQAAGVNDALRRFERNWLSPAGIPGRPWFKHLLFAPRYTYAAMTLPGITEAAEKGDWPVGREQAKLVAEAIARNTTLLTKAADALPPAPAR